VLASTEAHDALWVICKPF